MFDFDMTFFLYVKIILYEISHILIDTKNDE